MSEPGGLERRAFDVDSYVRRVRERCFICALVAGEPGYEHEVVHEDADTVAFLSAYPTLLGYCLVAPKRHVERLVEELDVEEYLAVQRVVYDVARAITTAVPTERMYVLSLGSQQGNAHVHWHVAPLPPGVPYADQQFHAVMAENGVLDVPAAQQAAVAAAIRAAL